MTVQSFEYPANCWKCFEKLKIGSCHPNLFFSNHILHFWLQLLSQSCDARIEEHPNRKATGKLNKKYPTTQSAKIIKIKRICLRKVQILIEDLREVIKNIATGETSPAITPYHTYHFSISTSLTFIISKLQSQNDFHHLITFITR